MSTDGTGTKVNNDNVVKSTTSKNNQTVSSAPGNNSKSGTSNSKTGNVATIQQQDLMNFQPQNPITTGTSKSINTTASGTITTTPTTTSNTTTNKPDPCASLRNSGKFKSVTTMSDGRCSVDCGYGKYFDAVNKTCESQYDVPGNTQRSSKGVINAPAVSDSNSGNSTKSNTQPQRTNKQIMDEGVAKSNKQDNLFYGNIACWLKLNGGDGVEKTTVMDDGTCKIQCEQGYVFNSPKKRCERGIFGFRTGYMN